MTNGTNTWTYTYDANGLRTKRTNGNYTYEYIYDGSGKLVFMQYHHYKMYFTYDPLTGAPHSVYYDDSYNEQYTMYYITNTRGDVLAMAKEDGTIVVSYDYDAWGNLIHYEDSTLWGTGDINPLRYRGYVYDRETGLYYLQSRYYDPEIGRFINADDVNFLGANGDFASYNLFAYCGNNPVSRRDASGQLWELIAAGAVASIISGISNAINTACSGGTIEECLIAGVAGTVGGAVGFAVAVATGFSPLGNVAARATTTIVSDLGTSLALNGKITTTDIAYAAIDVTMDVCLSPIAYYYNPVEKLIPQTAINALADGIIDYAETKLYFTPHPTSAELRDARRAEFMERRLTTG